MNTCTESMTGAAAVCGCEPALTPVVLKERAEAVLISLAKAKSECERHMAAHRRVDLVKAVTGTSSIERAMDETRKTINALEIRLAPR